MLKSKRVSCRVLSFQEHSLNSQNFELAQKPFTALERRGIHYYDSSSSACQPHATYQLNLVLKASLGTRHIWMTPSDMTYTTALDT